MSDLHRFPLLGREMPDDIRPTSERAHVFRVAEHRWMWKHCCPGVIRRSLFLCPTQAQAFREALEHMSRCR